MKEITSTDTTLPLESIVGRLEGGEIDNASLLRLPGIVLSSGETEGIIRHYRFHPETDTLPITPIVCQSKKTLPTEIDTELLVKEGHIVSLSIPKASITLRPELVKRFAIREVLQREWLLSVFLFGPVLGVFLVNMIFGMPTFLWWTALAVLVFSCLIMGILVRNDLRRLRLWVNELHEAGARQNPSQESPNQRATDSV